MVALENWVLEVQNTEGYQIEFSLYLTGTTMGLCYNQGQSFLSLSLFFGVKVCMYKDSLSERESVCLSARARTVFKGN